MVCEKCKREFDESSFWKNKNNEYENICKDCMFEVYKLIGFNPKLSPAIFEHFNIPILLDDWYRICPKATTLKEVFGKYLARMKLKGYRSFGFNDQQWFDELKEEKRQKRLKQLEEFSNI